MSYKGSILIIDDNVDLLEYLKDFFMIYNYEVILAENGNEGIEKFREFSPDIVISDIRLPDKSGNIVVKEIKEIDKDVPIIVITGYSDHNLILSAMKNGAVELLKKPFKPKDLKYLISKIETLFKKIKVKLSSSFLQWEKRHLKIANDIHIIPSVTDFIFSNVDYIFGEISFMKIGLQEILINAIEHGNLDISYDDKQQLLTTGEYNRVLKHKAALPENVDKYVDIKVFSTPEYLKLIIEDMGEGFDLSAIPDPENPENFLCEHGKGIMMTLNAYDEVTYNEKGNKVTLLKYSGNKKHGKPVIKGELESFELVGKLNRLTKMKEEFDFELDLAAEFQNTFLPKKRDLDRFTGVRSDYIFIPLQKVSGDFIDITKLEESIYGYFISDISGHGVAAALISSMLKVFFSLYGKDVLSPELLYEILNEEFFSYLNSGEYFTSFYGIYFEEENKFVYTNANHPPPLLLKVKTGEIVPLNTEGFFVGVFKDTKFEEKEVFLEKGDRILFYTDGITEAKNLNMEEFGEGRLKKIYMEEANANISQLIQRIKDAAFEFAEGNIEDDVTIAIIEIN
ncbi:MAG: SpoIIE family protein phosphatase [Candidatus Aminicenantes bacterium]|nr:SpoIIE family protein phosphatase [Candidatus Aminicenantes bacterium]NIM81209.1 SpoIIE family protein phosphatase [Candidatus Aminicenantes bacterium]NIN20584.1 SpoIIE family protein phosphatase [Candidatus Aminicenantes bacterium]NIN44363.1 SpoIIE family protein phosphatase [Candidatus Aminicenantes bacterium]NIN87182.1 SpoIIE family protein phosphatase [Candidatus Aminicenantes bacterium]